MNITGHFCSYFLFVNDSSGEGLGGQIINDEVFKYQLKMKFPEFEQKMRVDVYIISLKIAKEQGFEKLKELVSKNMKVVLVIAGGDGSVMWVIKELAYHKIDPRKTPLAVIPLGTWNDFSRVLGWGSGQTVLDGWNVKTIKQLVYSWAEAKEQNFDIWDVVIEAHENGSFYGIKDSQEVALPGKIFKNMFNNYFSFGIDARIGYSFDKYRTKSTLGNAAVYGVVGAEHQIEQIASLTKSINEIVKVCYTTEDASLQNIDKNQSKLIFSSDGNQKHQLKKGQMNMLALNIDSYTAGSREIWKNSHSAFKAKDQNRKQQYYPQSYHDGIIELVCFDSPISLALQRLSGGFAKKVAQTSNPVIFQFYKAEGTDDKVIHFQIDGEFFKLTNPKLIMIKNSQITPSGQIKVLKSMRKSPFNPEFDV